MIQVSRNMNIVTIGGGTGQFTLLQALRDFQNLDITAVVSMADSGGSSGRLRDELGALPPGDILKALLALSTLPGGAAREVLLHRFNDGALSGHTAGNMLLTILSQYSGNFLEAVKALGELLKIRGKVLPVTTGQITLRARLEDGAEIIGEKNIDVPLSPHRPRINEVWLEPNAFALGDALQAIKKADCLIVSPGDLFTSIVPVLLVRGVKEALADSRAKLIYICNTMTKPGETSGFRVSDFVNTVEKYAGKKLNIILANNTRPNENVLSRYLSEYSSPVIFDLSAEAPGRVIAADLLAEGELARHDPKKIAKTLEPFLKHNQ